MIITNHSLQHATPTCRPISPASSSVSKFGVVVFDGQSAYVDQHMFCGVLSCCGAKLPLLCVPRRDATNVCSEVAYMLCDLVQYPWTTGLLPSFYREARNQGNTSSLSKGSATII